MAGSTQASDTGNQWGPVRANKKNCRRVGPSYREQQLPSTLMREQTLTNTHRATRRTEEKWNGGRLEPSMRQPTRVAEAGLSPSGRAAPHPTPKPTRPQKDSRFRGFDDSTIPYLTSPSASEDVGGTAGAEWDDLLSRLSPASTRRLENLQVASPNKKRRINWQDGSEDRGPDYGGLRSPKKRARRNRHRQPPRLQQTFGPGAHVEVYIKAPQHWTRAVVVSCKMGEQGDREYQVRLTEYKHPARGELRLVPTSRVRAPRGAAQRAKNGLLMDLPAVGVVLEYLTFEELISISLTNRYWYRNTWRHVREVTPICRHYEGITSEDLKNFLSRMSPALKSLDLRFVCQAVDDSMLECIAINCRGLTELNLYNCAQITNDGVVAIAQHMKQLQALYIGACPEVKNNGVDEICRNCTSLQSLDISWNWRCSSRCMNTIKTLENLTELKVFEAGQFMSFYDRIVGSYPEGRKQPLRLTGGLNTNYPEEEVEKQKETLAGLNIHYTPGAHKSISERNWALKLQRFEESKQATLWHAFKVPQSRKVYCVIWTELGTFACKLRQHRDYHARTPEEFIRWFNTELDDPLNYFKDELKVSEWRWLDAFQNLTTFDLVGFDGTEWITVGLTNYGNYGAGWPEIDDASMDANERLQFEEGSGQAMGMAMPQSGLTRAMSAPR